MKDDSDHDGTGKCGFVPYTVLAGMVHDPRYDDHAKKAPVVDINTRSRDHTIAAGKKSRAA